MSDTQLAVGLASTDLPHATLRSILGAVHPWFATALDGAQLLGAFCRIVPRNAGLIVAEYGFRNDHVANRTTPPHAVEMLKRDIAAGDFVNNGETIVFDLRPRLLNGHTRLRAVAAADRPILTWVWIGFPERVMDSYDQQRRRSASDAFEMKGLPHPKVLPKVIGLVNAFRHQGSFSRGGHRCTLTNREVETEHYDRPMIARAAAFVAGFNPKLVAPLRVGPSLLAALYYVLATVDQDQAERFIRGVVDGQGEGPHVRLHAILLEKGKEYDHVKKAALLIKAWNSFYGKRRLSLTWRPLDADGDERDPFPEIDGIRYVGDGRERHPRLADD